MIITVNSGDTLFSISESFKVPVEKIKADNGIYENSLVVGQSLIIDIPKTSFYTDSRTTAENVSYESGITEKTLFRNNYSLMGENEIEKNTYIVTEYESNPLSRKITGGYAYDFISTERLRSVINYLSYIMPFTYGFNEDGSLIPPDDIYILEQAYKADINALLHISTLTDEGYFDSSLPSVIFNNPDSQNSLTDNLISEVINKGYSGIDIDFEFLPEQEKENYENFISELSLRLHDIGKILVVAVPPRTSDEQRGLLIDAIEYESLGKSADYLMLMTYEYGYKFGPARAVAPINEIEKVIEYAVSRVPSQKLLLGISNYGYDWTLPYISGESDAPSISTVEAIELAVKYGAEIMFDEASMAPFFFYTDEDERIHEVWFEDARSFKAKADLIEKYNLAGGFIWDLMRENPQGFVTLNSLIDII